jgi:hypothetical protein
VLGRFDWDCREYHERWQASLYWFGSRFSRFGLLRFSAALDDPGACATWRGQLVSTHGDKRLSIV